MPTSMPLTPLMVMKERSLLLAASMAPDSASGAFPASYFGASLIVIDSSGSTATQRTIAKLNPSAASSTAWAPFRAKDMLLAGDQTPIEVGQVVALQTQYGAAPSEWRGALTLEFRRVDE